MSVFECLRVRSRACVCLSCVRVSECLRLCVRAWVCVSVCV